MNKITLLLSLRVYIMNKFILILFIPFLTFCKSSSEYYYKGSLFKDEVISYIYNEENKQELNKKISILTAEATNGDPVKQYHLGLLYIKGIGVAKNEKEAARWFRFSAQQGYSPAQNCLGDMYMSGLGLMYFPTESILWYRLAAEQGNSDAQNNLGIIYTNGITIKTKNNSLSIDKENLRYKNEMDKFDIVTHHQSRNERLIDKNQLENIAIPRDNTIMYLNKRKGNKLVSKDYQQAVMWFRKAAEQDNSYGQMNLAYMYEKGYGVKVDIAEAIEWYKKAADHGVLLAEEKIKRLQILNLN